MSKNSSYQELLKKKPEPKVFDLKDFVNSFILTASIVLFFKLIAGGSASWKLMGIGFLICLIVTFLVVWFWGYYGRTEDTYYNWQREYVVPFLNNLPINVLIEEKDIIHIGNLDVDGCFVSFVLNGKIRNLYAEVEVAEIESPYITCVELEENVHQQRKGDLLHVTLHVSREDLKKNWTV